MDGMTETSCAPSEDREVSLAWRLLRSGVPLTLLLDLIEADPHSAEIHRVEQPFVTTRPTRSAAQTPASGPGLGATRS